MSIEREEYDEDRKVAAGERKVLREAVIEKDRKDKLRNVLYGWVLFAVTLLAVLSVYGALVVGPNDARSVAEEIRLSQYEVCQDSGNVLREQVRDELADLKEDVLIPVFSGVARTIPEGATSKVILDDSVTYLRKRIRTIEERIPDADCLDLYPPLEGQVYP